MNKTKRIIRSSSLKRKSTAAPSAKVHLERVLGFTIQNNSCLATSIDGTLAYPAGCVVVLYNPKRTKQSHIFNVSKKTITSLAFSGDGKHLVTGESGHQPAVRVWELESCSQVTEFHGHKFGITCVAFSPNLKYIISIGTQHDMTANVWNWKSNCKIASNKVTSKVTDVAFSEDGSYFVTAGIRHIKFWYLDSTKSRINETVPLMGRAALLGEHKNNTFCGVCCGRGKAASSTFAITKNGLLCELNEKRYMDKWVELRTTSANCLAVTGVYIFIGCADGAVRIFSTETLHFITSLPRPHHLGIDVSLGQDPRDFGATAPKDAKYPDTVAISYDFEHHKLVCVYKDHSMYVWDVTDVKRPGKHKSFLYHSSSIWGLEVYPKVTDGPVLPDGTFITCSSDDTIRVWNINPSLSTDTYYKRNIYSYELLKVIYIDPELTFLCEKEDTSGKKDATDNTHLDKNGIRCVRVSPEGRHLASGDRLGNLRIHNLRTCEEEHFMEAHDAEVLCLEFTDPSTGVNLMASTGRDRLLHVFHREQGYGLLQTLDDHSAAVTAVKFAVQDNDLHMISCGVDKSMLFRHAVKDPTYHFELSRHLVLRNTLYDMTVDPSHKFVATACQDRNVRIYNMRNGKQKTCYSGSAGTDGTLLRIELDRSGALVATSCSDKNLCILDFFTGELLATMFGHSEVVTGVKFSNDMRHLISVSGDGCIFIWRLPKDFAEEMNSRRMKLADPTAVVNGETPAASRGLTTVPKSMPNLAGHDSTDIGESVIPLDGNANVPEPAIPDYRFSIGQLPGWAKKQVLQEPLKPPSSNPVPSMPSGAWAKNVKQGSSVPLKSTMDDSTIQLSLADCMDKRRFTVEADTLTNQIQQLGESRRLVTMITDDDENNRDDDEDDEFHNMTNEHFEEDLAEGDAETSEMDSSRVNMFRGGLVRKDSQYDFDVADEADTADVIYMDNDEMDALNSPLSPFQVFEGDVNSAREMSSEGTDVPSLDDVSDDDNDATGSDSGKGAATPDQEKFLTDNFLKMEMLDQDASSINRGMSHRQSFSARFLTRGQQQNLRQQAAHTAAVNRNIKKKEEVGKAIEESRKKLQADNAPMQGRRSGGTTNRRRPEPGSDRRKTIGETISRPGSKADTSIYGALKKNNQSRSEKNILAAVENMDSSEKRKSLNVPEDVPSYMKQTSSSSSKLSRTRSGHNLMKEEGGSRSTSPRPPSRTGNATPTSQLNTSAATKAAAARKSATARRERLNPNLKSRFKSSPNLAEKNLALKDENEECSTGGLSMPPSPRLDSPPLSVFDDNQSRDDQKSSSELQDKLAMPPPPLPPPSQLNKVPKSSTFHNIKDLQGMHNEPAEQPLDSAPKKVAPSRDPAFASAAEVINSPRLESRVADRAALFNKIVEANQPSHVSPSTARTMAEINEVAKSSSVGFSPWHSTRNSGTSGIIGSPYTTRSNRGQLERSGSSDSLDETPVKEERRAKVEMSNIRLSSPAPPPLPSQPPPPLPSHPPPATLTDNTFKQSPPNPVAENTWVRTQGPSVQAQLNTREHDKTVKPVERLNLRRREGEPDDLQDSNRRFGTLGNTLAPTSDSGLRSPYARPRSSIDSTMGSSSGNLEPAESPRTRNISGEANTEGRVRTGTILSKNKELLTNLLSSRSSNHEGISASPQVPRRSRGNSTSNINTNVTPDATATALKLQWLKQKADKHPLDLSGSQASSTSASQSSSTSNSAVTSPRLNMGMVTSSVQREEPMAASSLATPTTLSLTSASGSIVPTTAAVLSSKSNSSLNNYTSTVTASQSLSSQQTVSASFNGEAISPEVAIGSQSSAFRRTSGPKENTSQSPPTKESSLHNHEDSSQKNDRSSLKLDLRKVNHPAPKPEELQPIIEGLKQHTEKLASIFAEYPELLKPNIQAGKDMVKKLNKAFGLDLSSSDETKDTVNVQLLQQFSQKVCDLMDAKLYERVDERVSDLLEKKMNRDV